MQTLLDILTGYIIGKDIKLTTIKLCEVLDNRHRTKELSVGTVLQVTGLTYQNGDEFMKLYCIKNNVKYIINIGLNEKIYLV